MFIIPKSTNDLVVTAQTAPAIHEICQEFLGFVIAKIQWLIIFKNFKIPKSAYLKQLLLSMRYRISEHLHLLLHFLLCYRFHNITTGMQFKSLSCIVTIACGKNDIYLRMNRTDLPGEINSIHISKFNVQESHVTWIFPHERKSLLSISKSEHRIVRCCFQNR